MLRRKLKTSLKLNGLYGIHLIRWVFRIRIGLLVELEIRVAGALVAVVLVPLFVSGTLALPPACVIFFAASGFGVVADAIVVGVIDAIVVEVVVEAIL